MAPHVEKRSEKKTGKFVLGQCSGSFCLLVLCCNGGIVIVFLIFWCMSLDNHKILSCKKPLLELFVFISEVERFYFNIYLG